MQFSILVTSFNDSKNFKDFLDEIENQSLKPKEIIIADGGSEDDSNIKIVELQKKYIFPIRYIPSIRRLNIAEGYNVAVRACKTNLFIIMGIGNRYSYNFCECVIEYFNNYSVDYVYTPILGINNNKFAKAFNIAFVGGKLGKHFELASNRGVLLTKHIFEKIGYFYENFVYAGEDSEYFMRAKNAGLKSGYVENAKVYWETPKTFKQYLQKNQVNAIADMQYMSNKILIKHIFSRFGIVIVSIFSSIISIWLTIAIIVAAISVVACKIKSLNIKAILLRFHFIFLPSYYYLKYIKYFDKNYKVDLEKMTRG